MKAKSIPIIFGLALAGPASAGTLNVDFENGGPNTITMTTPGLLGDGNSWNTAYDSGLVNPVHDDGTQFSNPVIVVVANNGGSIGADTAEPAVTTNNIQRDGINNSNGSLDVFITNLRHDIPLKLILYFNAGNPPWSVRTTITETGESKIVAGATLPHNVEDAVEGADYLVFEGPLVNENGILQFTIVNATNPASYSRICGLQIQGWLPGEEFPSKTDLLISTERNSRYTGSDVYGGRQLKKVAGRRKGKFYYRLQNDSDAWANYGLRGKANDEDAVRKWFDLRNGRANISAEVASGLYNVSLDPGERRLILGVLRARPGTRKAVSVLRGFAAEDHAASFGDRNKAIVKP